MTSLRMFETDDARIAEDATSPRPPDLFETPTRSARSRWPYDVSVLLHAIALIALVSLARYLTPPQRPTRALTIERVSSVFVLPALNVDNARRRPPGRTPPRPRKVPAAIVGTVAAAPAPAALGDARVVDPRPIAEEKPAKSAFDPPIPVGNARLTGRRGDPTEAGLGSATVNARGSPTAEIRPGGLGEGSVRGVGGGASTFSVRPGFDDASADGGGGGGASPPRIQEPLPVPDYPADARTRRLQAVVVLEVMLDTLGKAHVRGVLSRPVGFGIEEAARSAAERLKFTPARQGGRSVDAIVQVRVTFTLTDGVATAVTGGA